MQVCRDECEVLEYDVCRKELAIARSQPMINHQLVLPDCHELPVVGSTGSYNCVRLGIAGVSQLIKPHSCFGGDGGEYRGTVSVTKSGSVCKPWHLNFASGNGGGGVSNFELVGGHNFCRNPEGAGMSQPWCYTNDPRWVNHCYYVVVDRDWQVIARLIRLPFSFFPVSSLYVGLIVKSVSSSFCDRRRRGA